MILIKILLLTSSLFALLAPSKTETKTEYKYSDEFDYIFAPPIYAVKGGKFEAKIDFRISFQNPRLSKKELNIYQTGDDDVERVVYTMSMIGNAYSESISFECPNTSFNRSDYPFRLVATSSKGTVLVEHDFIFKIEEKDNVIVPRLDNQEYVTDPRIYIFQDGHGDYYSEKYEFCQCGDRYFPFFTSDFSFSRISFSYEFLGKKNTFKYDLCTFFLTNKNGYFNNVGHPNFNFEISNFPLDIFFSDIDENYHFMFQELHYVNPLTLEMSSTLKSGFVATPDVFYPRDQFLESNGMNLGFVIYGAGYSHLTIGVNYVFSPLLTLLGDCHTSQYCIASSFSKPDFTLGQTYTHG